MKLAQLLLAGLLVLSISAYGQNAHFLSEISGSCGTFPSFQVSDAAYLSGYNDTQRSGGYAVTLKHRIKNNRSLNISVTYEQEKGTIADHYARFKRQCFTVAAEYSKVYLHTTYVNLYCTFGMGVAYRYEPFIYGVDANHGNNMLENVTGNNTRIQMNIYVSPFGIRIGKQYGVFGEAGIGYKGVVCAGIFWNLNTKS